MTRPARKRVAPRLVWLIFDRDDGRFGMDVYRSRREAREHRDDEVLRFGGDWIVVECATRNMAGDPCGLYPVRKRGKR